MRGILKAVKKAVLYDTSQLKQILSYQDIHLICCFCSFIPLLKTPIKAGLVSTNGVLGGISSYEYVVTKWKLNDQVFLHWCSSIHLFLLKDSVVLWPPKASDLHSLMPFSQNLMDLRFQGPQNIMHREGMSNLWFGSHKNEVSIKIAADGKFKV